VMLVGIYGGTRSTSTESPDDATGAGPGPALGAGAITD